MLEIWKAKFKKENNHVLPMIIPLVIYHSKEGWNSELTLGKMITGYKGLSEAEVKEMIAEMEK